MPTIRSILLLAAVILAACGEAEPVAPHSGHSSGDPSGALCPDDNTLNYQNFGKPFMDLYCNQCHSSALVGADRHGAPVRHDFDTLEGIRDLMGYIDGFAAAGPRSVNRSMPPASPSPPPSDAERRKLGQWLACGAK